jgi:hypothetical protein
LGRFSAGTTYAPTIRSNAMALVAVAAEAKNEVPAVLVAEACLHAMLWRGAG